MKPGWIKLQKNLRDDPRVLRMATALRERHAASRDVTDASRTSQPSRRFFITLAIGGLFELWRYADAAAGDDDIARGSLEQIEELTGIEGFGEVVPSDWLVVLDPDRLQFPDFHKNNSKSKDPNSPAAIRNRRYRERQQGVTDASQDVTERNGESRDASRSVTRSTRPDHTRSDQNSKSTLLPPSTPNHRTNGARRVGSPEGGLKFELGKPDPELGSSDRSYAAVRVPDMDIDGTWSMFCEYHQREGTVARDISALWRHHIAAITTKGRSYARKTA